MKTVVAESEARSPFPEMATLENQVNEHKMRVAFCGPYRLEVEADVRPTRRSAVLKHTVSTGDPHEAVLVVRSRVEILGPGAGDHKRARIRLVVDGKAIFEGIPLDFTHDASGPLSNPPRMFFYGTDEAGRRRGLFLPNGSEVTLYVKGIKGRVLAGFDAALYTTRA